MLGFGCYKSFLQVCCAVLCYAALMKVADALLLPCQQRGLI